MKTITHQHQVQALLHHYATPDRGAEEGIRHVPTTLHGVTGLADQGLRVGVVPSSAMAFSTTSREAALALFITETVTTDTLAKRGHP